MTSTEFFAHLARRSGEAFSASRPVTVQRALNALGLIPTYTGQVRPIDAAHILVTLCLCPVTRPELIQKWIEDKQGEWGSGYNKNLFIVLAWLLKKKAREIQDIMFDPALGVMVVTFEKERKVYPENTDIMEMLRQAEAQIRQLVILPGAVIEEVSEIVSETEKAEVYE